LNKTNTHYQSYDFAFIGFGAANCLLLLRLIDTGVLRNKSIAVIEPSSKTKNDRTFCFWSTEKELEELHLTDLVSHSWNKIEIGNIKTTNIHPMRYWHVRGIDLYELTRNKLEKENVIYIHSYLSSVDVVSSNQFELKIEERTITAINVFDSRPPDYKKSEKNESHLYQSFFGWNISTKENCFDAKKMVMMDFNIPQNNFTQFMYILPYSATNSLIEVTRFGKEKITEDEANTLLKKYINKISPNYKLNEVEKGIIPMSSAQIKTDYLGENWINMGARNNKVKCTTGFAFHEMAKEAMLISAQFNGTRNKSNKPNKPNRFAFYDRLLLKILSKKPEKGKLIFEILFSKVPTIRVLNFLQERTKLKDDILLFSKLPKFIFIKMAVNDIFYFVKKSSIVFLPLFITLISILFYKLNLENIVLFTLIAGFMTIGLSHGALDHLTKLKKFTIQSISIFTVSYISKAVLYGVIWFITPDIALLGFVLYSAFHFGQADFKEWSIKSNVSSFLWGVIVLSQILFFHTTELIDILAQIPGITSQLIKKLSKTDFYLFIQILPLLSGLYLGIKYKRKEIIITLTYLLLSSFLPLLVSFGIYFTFQHSKNGWKHLKQGLDVSSKDLFIRSIPFTSLASIMLMSSIFVLESNQWGTFFIILSCLSLPHVASMHHFYLAIKRE